MPEDRARAGGMERAGNDKDCGTPGLLCISLPQTEGGGAVSELFWLRDQGR